MTNRFKSDFVSIPDNARSDGVIKTEVEVLPNKLGEVYNVPFDKPYTQLFGDYYNGLERKDIPDSLSKRELCEMEDLT